MGGGTKGGDIQEGGEEATELTEYWNMGCELVRAFLGCRSGQHVLGASLGGFLGQAGVLQLRERRH